MRVPKYFGVKQAILASIADAEPGTAIPTERELAEAFSTSRTTVRQAIAELVVDGRLERAQGRGTFVAHPKLMHVRPLTSFSQDLATDGREPGSVVLGIEEREADADVRAALGLPEGARVHRVERLRTAGDELIAHETAYVPGPLPSLVEELRARGSLYATLAEVYDLRVDVVEDVVETILADPIEADLLGVDTGLPLLLVHRTAWTEDGRPVEWTRSAFRGDRFTFVTRHRLDPDRRP